MGLDLQGESALYSLRPPSYGFASLSTLANRFLFSLALANWFRSSNIRVRLIEKKPGTTPRGQAEGIKSTTVEIFESFGIGHQIWAEAWRLEEIAIWGPTKTVEGGIAIHGIEREQVHQNRVPELGKTREICLQQCGWDP